jgi:hypothetical protein
LGACCAEATAAVSSRPVTNPSDRAPRIVLPPQKMPIAVVASARDPNAEFQP